MFYKAYIQPDIGFYFGLEFRSPRESRTLTNNSSYWKNSIFVSMINVSDTYQKGRLSKVLLSVAVLFSVFSFTGYGSHTQTNLERAVNTEIVVKKAVNGKRCISYKRLFAFYRINEVSKEYLSKTILAIGLFQNSVASLKIQNTSKHILPTKLIFLRKIISDNPSDVYLIS